MKASKIHDAGSQAGARRARAASVDPSTVAAPRISRRAAGWRLCSMLGALATVSGCAAYRFGSASLYPSDIQTVYVPVFESNSFRRNLSEQLTELVCKEIELRTPYKVVGDANADSVLSGKLLGDTKRVIIEDAEDQPREVETNIAVQVRWVNRKGDMINQANAIPLPQDLVNVSASGNLVAEYGQSVTTAQLQAMQKLATQIVSLMEMPW